MYFFVVGGETGRICKSEARKKAKEQLKNSLDLELCSKIDPDVCFSLIAYGIPGDYENRNIPAMPESIASNGRRRWTHVWTAWNSAFAIVVACLTAWGLWSLRPFDVDNGLIKLILIGVVVILFLSGLVARSNVWAMEEAWLEYEIGRQNSRSQDST